VDRGVGASGRGCTGASSAVGQRRHLLEPDAAGHHPDPGAAREVLAERAGDGSDMTPPPFVSTMQPGDYRPTPPALAAPVFTHWPAVTPFRATSPPGVVGAPLDLSETNDCISS
jgi:hypothetical protein